MVVVDEEHEQPHVVLGNLDLFVDAVAQLARRRLAGPRIAVDANQAELLDRLRLPVLEHFEVGLRQVGDRLALVVVDDDVDADEVDAGAEDRLRLLRVALRRGRRRRAGRRLALLLSRRLAGSRLLQHAHADGKKQSEGYPFHTSMIPSKS